MIFSTAFGVGVSISNAPSVSDARKAANRIF
jgi:hypothetical protein